GTISVSARGMVRELVALNVTESKVDSVIHTVAGGIGVNVLDHIDTRSVRRVVSEAGIAAELQIVDELRPENSAGFTLSSDGTTIRHRTFESRHVTLLAPNYASKYGEPKREMTTRLLGITNAPNHTSETQLKGLQELTTGYYSTYNSSNLGKQTPVDLKSFAANILGLGSDHAEDQKKLARLLEDWKVTSAKFMEGKRVMESLRVQDLLPIINEIVAKKITQLGGMAVWDRLSKEEKERHNNDTINQVCTQFGENAWNGLSEDERARASMFIWAGCCMHKELNSVKGGVRGLMEFWKSVGEAPIKLMNRANAAAVDAGPGKAHDNALEVSEGGGVKLTSLAGAVFRHKDDKKGQQDTYRMFFENRVGYTIRFPDTSNTRFQSHCSAAAELIVNLPVYLEFLLFVRDKKQARNFNHMENNIFLGLKDIPTLTELCTLALYSEAVSKPYMRLVRRGGKDRVNALDLGPVHSKVKNHCRAIINNPDLILGAGDGDFTHGTLDHELWERPDVIYAVQRLSPSMPHLKGCISAFFSGALDTWERLTSEFREGGKIDVLNSPDRARIFINSTNDHNEGALGTTRLMLRKAPSLTTTTISSKAMYTRNSTEDFIQARLPRMDQWKFVMGEARKREAMRINRRQRELEIQHDEQEVNSKRQRALEQHEKEKAKQDEISAVTPELNLESLQKGVSSSGKKLTVTEIRLQLEWHRRIAPDVVLPKPLLSKSRREDLLRNLI
ncbi:hypothetical protein FA15DRAFT_573000, partial [Coprinopsis marcescibilis]